MIKQSIIKKINTYNNKRNNLNFGIFTNERTYFKFKKIKEKPLKIHKTINNLLQINDFEIEDYKSGIAVNKKNKQKIKIGKLLNKLKANNYTKKLYESRLKGKLKNAKSLQIVISYNPIDIALMSTNKGWTSCMNLNEKNTYNHQVFYKIQYGGLVAYLIYDTDTNIENPIARISIRRFQLNDKFVFIPEDAIYGSNMKSFKSEVIKILNKNNKKTCKIKTNETIILKDAEKGYTESLDEKIIIGKEKYTNHTGKVIFHHPRKKEPIEFNTKKAYFSFYNNGSINWKRGECIDEWKIKRFKV